MLKAFILFLLLSSTLWSKDLTFTYLKGKDQTLASEVNALQKYKVLIIPGVLAQSFISDSNNQIKLSFLFEDGFKEQINLLETLKIDYEFLNLETENSPEKNAVDIIDIIEKSSKPVLIYSHSKGGLDVLEAIRQKPGILSKIHGWASIQSPFWGAPVASGFNNNLVLRDSSNNLFEWMGGDASGMSSLTIEEREAYMNTVIIKNLLIQVNQKIKFLNFASYKTNTFGIDTPLELFRNFTDEKSGKNDGVVPLKSALMKEHGIDVNYIIEAEVDHLMTMTRYRLDNNHYNQKTHTISVLKMLL
jgi:triacylglycerol lipase